MSKLEGRKRAVIEGVKPEIDAARFPIKRVLGDRVVVEADVFTDGHDSVSARLMYRKSTENKWRESTMALVTNDRWRGAFVVSDLGEYVYTVTAWVDHFKTWRLGLQKKVEARQEVSVDLLIGAQLIEETSKHEGVFEANRLIEWVDALRSPNISDSDKVALALSEEVAETMEANPDRSFASTYPRELRVKVDREKARFSTWYEMFPRSASSEQGKHGTFKDCEARLPYIAQMGFDVLYMPPIHPIGREERKGKNNVTGASPNDTGSPWAIGAREGGHRAIHPQLGTLKDFKSLVEKSREYGIEIALDIAFQCAPDHPYVGEKPEWFRWRPDGTVQYAENPPKKYQDIYPFEFENDDWEDLWDELTNVVLYWVEQGVKIFRVDNPHTKPLPFWEYLIRSVQADHPDVIFLAEAFTRPKVMHNLAKLGFTQSYTYFTWRNTRRELTEYLTELTANESKEFFRPNFWPNTPDILHEYLQFGGRPAFLTRLILAATMTANYGIYGPAFELCAAAPREPESEEYLNSEKYEIRHWDLESSHSLKHLIGRINRVRKDNPALQSNENVAFHQTDNDELICYSKRTNDFDNVIITVANLDPHHTQAGWVNLDLEALGLNSDEQFQVHDLIGDARYLWSGHRNFVELNPHVLPAHVFLLRQKVSTEGDFDYYV